jgi:hypothetical protein
MRRSAQADVASDSDREALGKSRGAEKKKSELEDLNWKFQKKLTWQLRKWAQGTWHVVWNSATDWLAGWHEWAKGPAVWPLTVQPMTLQNEVP